jgi:hypothetical protein
LRADGTADAFRSEDLASCRFEPTRQEHLAKRCGDDGVRPPLDIARLDEAVLDIDEATRARVIEVASRGRSAGRRLDALGLAGDSLTVAPSFLGAFGADATVPFSATEEVLRALNLHDAKSIIDHYRGVDVVHERGMPRDSFGATRAARVGARARWLADHDEVPGASPIDRLVSAQSPAIAFVLVGTNDAAYGTEPPEKIADDFEADLGRVVDAFESRGVVVVLSTLPRHGRQPGVELCGDVSNWGLVVRTNAVHRAVARVACTRALPLIDLRHALEPLPNRGLGPDGVHLSAHRLGAGKLDEEGLACGFNVRNYVTLRMLARLHPIVSGAP